MATSKALMRLVSFAPPRPLADARLVLAGLLVALASPAMAQEGAPAREARYQKYLDFSSLTRGGVVSPGWLPDGNGFWYADHAPDSTVIYRVDPAANTKAPLFDLPRVRAAVASVLGYQPAFRGLPFDRFVWTEDRKGVRFEVEGRTILLDVGSYTARQVSGPTPGEESLTTPQRINPKEFGWPILEVPSPDGRWFALHQDHNLWLRSSKDGRVRQLTTDGVEDREWIVGGGLFVGPVAAQWSPDGNRLAAFRLDSRNVRRQPIVHWLDPAEQVDLDLNPIPGGAIQQLELAVVDVQSQRVVKIDAGPNRDQLLYVIGWRPDGKELLFYRMSRDFRRLDVMGADPETGASRVVITETSKTFIEGYTDWRSLLLTPLWEQNQFLWLSERDGWRHLYLYDFNGQLVRRLTSGSFPVTDVASVDRKRGWVYFFATSDPARPYDRHFHRVNLQGQGFARLTQEPGQHQVALSPSQEYLVDTHSDLDRPPMVVLRRADGTPLQTLAVADTTGLAGLGRRPIERFVAKAADGTTDLYGVLFKPRGFDPSRKYPVIEVFYPGSQTTAVPRDFQMGWLGVRAQSWAELGYVTFVVDGRGGPGRSKAFQDVVYLGHGRNEIPDHAAVVRQLIRTHPYMDSTRVGVWGHSWGGYFAIRALLLAPDVYQVGVASAPLADLENAYYPTEPYMLTPQANPEGYEYSKNTKFADRLRGKLLMIVGSNDGAHLMGSVFRQAQAFIGADKLFDMMILPGQDHGYTGAGARFADRYVREYFGRHLGPADATDP